MANPMTKILAWLRAGYPEGVPQGDYIALLGLLHRSLTDEEVERLAIEFYRGEQGVDDSLTEDQIRATIREQIHLNPSKDDVLRVLERIEAGGWPHVHPSAEPSGH
ncbi:uncharacterized protein DUF3349 [Luteococcus japonicus]|uniref:Uncharacterized protein DUF3349 n=1 Tax=Luteococcus japonicus TaxID=33984 RepID=A0A3N1ZXH1_9ACTN|nr:DUF3349 domain-containing protein [Luteococcus japonicus]ROR55550.1 uncharacterized protein DUF3349 [Luteococcus japonicus]